MVREMKRLQKLWTEVGTLSFILLHIILQRRDKILHSEIKVTLFLDTLYKMFHVRTNGQIINIFIGDGP
ncbi:Hypothetical predicted protein [Podarcis lilfordi]|uniref:Uncharacterized protein n=1 Tax=Podarcis lilfordi TaxID=74358 RepID=A0AA35JRD4_9SAUR|nr:Hypothetical predicted protein [Podarcis lilfordi]